MMAGLVATVGLAGVGTDEEGGGKKLPASASARFCSRTTVGLGLLIVVVATVVVVVFLGPPPAAIGLLLGLTMTSLVLSFGPPNSVPFTNCTSRFRLLSLNSACSINVFLSSLPSCGGPTSSSWSLSSSSASAVFSAAALNSVPSTKVISFCSLASFFLMVASSSSRVIPIISSSFMSSSIAPSLTSSMATCARRPAAPPDSAAASSSFILSERSTISRISSSRPGNALLLLLLPAMTRLPAAAAVLDAVSGCCLLPPTTAGTALRAAETAGKLPPFVDTASKNEDGRCLGVAVLAVP